MDRLVAERGDAHEDSWYGRFSFSVRSSGTECEYDLELGRAPDMPAASMLAVEAAAEANGQATATGPNT